MIKNIFVNKFMCYYPLETGGLVISRFSLCVYTSVQCFIVYAFVKTIIECQDLEKLPKPLTHPDIGLTSGEGNILVITDQITDHDDSDASCYEIKNTFVYATLAMVLFALMIISFLSIKGTIERNCWFIKPLMICHGFLGVLSAILVVIRPINGIIPFIIYGYTFIVLYSLYTKLKEENELEENVELELPDSKI